MPRAAFARPEHAGLAQRDVALPTGCGQTIPAPLFVGRLLAGCRLQPAMRVLVVGVEAGYAAGVLSHLVAEVVAIDRFRTLVDGAAATLARLGRHDVTVRTGDAFDPPDEPPFDRVLVMGLVETVPARLWSLVKPGGALVHARPAEPGQGSMQAAVLVERPIDGISKQLIIGPSRLPPLRPGLALRL